ncbi:hypothetical protein D3C75_603660 [compost metagenome]
MEQRDHFVMSKQRGFAIDRAVEVTGQVGDRFLQRAIGFTHLAYAIIHPRPAAFVFAGIQVEIEAATQLIFLVI